MPIIGVDARPTAAWEGDASRPLLVFTHGDQTAGLLVDEIVDIVESALDSRLASQGAGAAGSLIIDGRATELLDFAYYWRRAVNEDEPPRSERTSDQVGDRSGVKRLLVVDSSPFAQVLLRPLLSSAGYDVTVAEDPSSALALYEAGERFQLIMTDTRLDSAQAMAFAKVFAQASEWHQTPLLGLALGEPGVDAKLDATNLLDELAATLSGLKGAA